MHIAIPTGTKVVLAADGRVGVVIQSPGTQEDEYRVRFPDGSEQSCHSSEIDGFKRLQNAFTHPTEVESLLRFVQYKCIVGSTAYGLNTEDSDLDRRGFYLPPAERHWSLVAVPEQLETPYEEVYWEAGKFIRLALKANPNVLECLYSPMQEFCSPLANRLLESRQIFLSRDVYRSYNAYVLSQFKKIAQDLRNSGAVRWKHVMHLIRLLLSAVVILREGFVPLRMDDHRDELLAIRRGEVPWDAVEQWRLSLHRQLEDAYAATALPEQPDFNAANDLLVELRREAARPEYAA